MAPTTRSPQITAALETIAASDEPSFKQIVFAPDRYIPVADRHLDQPLHLSINQLLRVISTIKLSPSPLTTLTHEGSIDDDDDDNTNNDQIQILFRSLNTTTHGTSEEQCLGGLTRRKLPNWSDWQAAKFKQLDSMAKQEMYCAPVHAPKDSVIFRQRWNYIIKSNGTRKACNCCDGSLRAAPQLILANTYSSCIEQPCMQMFFALCTHKGFISLKVDATNAYANSPPADQPTFVIIDDEYADWHLVRCGITVSCNMVLPVQHALHGQPESGAFGRNMSALSSRLTGSSLQPMSTACTRAHTKTKGCSYVAKLMISP